MPTHVAGFKAWLRLGRCVRRGERGIPILAPVRVKDRGDDGEETGDTRLFFRTVHVWDVSQTEALPGREPAPLVPPRAPVEGDSHGSLLGPLEALAAELGYEVAYLELGRLDGLCDHRRRRIQVADRLVPNARMSVLVHELAHALVGHEAGLANQQEELVGEAVAFIVCAGAGLDTSPDSVPYIASWAGDDMADQLEKAAELIDSLARRIEQAIRADRRQRAGPRAQGRLALLTSGVAPLVRPSVARTRADGGRGATPPPRRHRMAPHDKPTTLQLRYLRRLAELTGTTFTPPATRRQASQEIEQLKERPGSSRLERREDSRSVSQGLAREQPASSVRDDEVSGFGSQARWAGR